MRDIISKLNKGIHRIHYKRLLLISVNLLVVTSACWYAYTKVTFVTNRIKGNWETIKFAYDYPEIVNPLREEYTSQQGELKDSIIKKQTIMSEFVLDDGSKKE